MAAEHPDTSEDESGRDALFLAALVEALPAAVLLIDSAGQIQFASQEAARLVECRSDEMIGTSVLDFVDADTAWAYAAALAMAGDFSHIVVGPLRITVVTSTGQHRRADLWAMNHLDDPALEGIVCLITPETAAVGLAEAVTGLANHEPFAAVASRVVKAMAGQPTAAVATLLAAGESGFRLVAESDPVPRPDDGPWRTAVEVGARVLFETVDEAGPTLAAEARRAGFETIWVEPVGVGPEGPRGALVLWRDTAGRPTPNELNVVHQGAAILSLAWEEHERLA